MMRYALGDRGSPERSQIEWTVNVDAFRMDRIVSDAPAPGCGELLGVEFLEGGIWVNQLCARSVDWWEFSQVRIDGLVAEFLDRHGLVGKSDDAIDDYLDEHGLSLPSHPHLTFRTLTRGSKIRITGRFLREVSIGLIGNAI